MKPLPMVVFGVWVIADVGHIQLADHRMRLAQRLKDGHRHDDRTLALETVFLA